MPLSQQILTIFSSFGYGLFFYLLVYFNRKILFQKKLTKRLVSNILFILDMTLIYFIMIRYINNGIITYYSYLFIIIGIIFQKFIITRIKDYLNRDR